MSHPSIRVPGAGGTRGRHAASDAARWAGAGHVACTAMPDPARMPADDRIPTRRRRRTHAKALLALTR